MYLRSNFECGNNTIMKIVQKLCSVVTLAHDTGVIPVNPFRLYKFRFEETERDILTLEELNYLYNYQFVSKKLERVRDNYIFSCFTGIEDKKRRRANEGNRLIVKTNVRFCL